MKVNHEQTMEVIENLTNEITDFHTKAQEYNSQKDEIKNSSELNADGKNNRLNALAESFEKTTIAVNDKIKAILENILQIETDSVQQFNVLDPNLLHCVNLINALGGEAPEEIKDEIISKFYGNNKALEILKKVFARYELNTNFVDRAMINISALESKLKELENLFYFITRDYNNAHITIPSAYGMVENIKDILLIESAEE